MWCGTEIPHLIEYQNSSFFVKTQNPLMKTQSKYLEEINRLLADYLLEIEKSDLKPLSAQVYQVQSKNFVRWINGEFTPGEVKKAKKQAQDKPGK